MRPTCILFFKRVAGAQQQGPLVLKQWLDVATPTARNIARNILKECSPINSHALFERTQQVAIDPEEMESRKVIYQKLLGRLEAKPPGNPLHPIRSLSYLKGVVMLDLVARGEAEKIFRRREPTSEERQLLAHTKPLTLKQRKMRGALGPGKRPPVVTGGMVNEWLWSITERGRSAPSEQERSDLEFGLIYDKETKDAKIRMEKSRSGSGARSNFMTEEDVSQTAKKWS